MKLISFFYLMAFIFQIKYQELSHRVCRVVKRFFIRYLPQVIKRQTLIVTLYLKGRNEKIFDDISMLELNQHMVVANDHKVLEYIQAVNEKCELYNFCFQKILTKHECSLDKKNHGEVLTTLATDIIDSIPGCLRYGRNEMIHDITAMLLKLPLCKQYMLQAKVS